MGWTPYSGHSPERLIADAYTLLDNDTANRNMTEPQRTLLAELTKRYAAQMGVSAGESAVGGSTGAAASMSSTELRRAAEQLAAASAVNMTATGVLAAQRAQSAQMNAYLQSAQLAALGGSALAPPLRPEMLGSITVGPVTEELKGSRGFVETLKGFFK